MVELLVKAVDATHPDPVIDRQGCFKKGDPVVIAEDGHRWGAKEGTPLFVIAKIPGVSVDAAKHYMQSWERLVDISVLSADQATATYQAQVSCANPGASGQLNLTRAQVEGYLNNWGATVDSIDTNQVTFTLKLWDTLRSDGFWGADVSLVGFTLVNYVNPTAMVDINISGVLAQWSPHQIAAAVIGHGGAVVGYTEPVGRFTIDRDVVLAAFSQDLKDRLEDIYTRRQYYFNPSDVDTAIAAGGVVTLTAGQATNLLKSKMDL